MKRRIGILSVLVFALFTLNQSNSMAGSTLNSGSATSSYSCEWECSVGVGSCQRTCDDEYNLNPYPNPRWLMECYEFCRWQGETCTWNC